MAARVHRRGDVMTARRSGVGQTEKAEKAEKARDGEAPKILDVPVGLAATGTRRETDSMGAIDVPADRYWGAQTQRSLIHFSIGDDRMPTAVYRAYGHVKKAAAIVNGRTGRLPAWKSELIQRVADEVIGGELDEHFPLYVWQTGSGTQSNMNTNEVISNRAIQLVGGELGSKSPIHPNDHVNMGQSSNDTFPTAMHIAAVKEVHEHLLPSVRALHHAIEAKARQWQGVVKIGRTHLEDAVPLTVGQEWSGYAYQLKQAMERVTGSAEGLYELAMGGTAVGTGLNAPPGFGEQVATEIASATGFPFTTAANKFAAQGGLDAMVGASAGLSALAVPLMKIANDIRWLASGPRCGLAELHLPANEPGSSIMPGKVNPTQCEAMVMVCIQALSEDTAIAFAGSQGNFELNAMRPVIINNFLHSATILADACTKMRECCIEDAELNRDQIDSYVDRSLMLVTALSPVIGYDRASAIAHKADDEGTTLREAALASGYISAEDFDHIVRPTAMVGQEKSRSA
ncbi:class II fumarate hydratase [Streptomyces milbemycinicus]|uniref:class II fumarate hydratase n=1 Tax=Streptomyces milbemycinicus TaxID=476552 RepID=UPI0033C6B4BD